MMNVTTISRRPPSQSLQENSIKLSRAEMHKGYLILVNRDNRVQHASWDVEELPSSIMQANYDEEGRILLESKCIQQLSDLLDACGTKEDILAVSGYRTKETQEHIYVNSLIENGEAFTASYVAFPGASEHQTGLAVDVGISKGDGDYIRPSFPDDGASGMFKKRAAEFGFIQRYEEGKREITGIACEEWHYRYVGVPHSLIMKEFHLCLEEYTEYVKEHRYNCNHLYVVTHFSLFEIYYVKAEREETIVPIVNGNGFEVSGNNKDGFVVTVCHRSGAALC
ncbi:D-alanyl-D-alanine carboxypeptidase family protein [Paenibacillus sp. GSMTC-2017]|uniref:D-alanyl-D-alanine carboxypeptidase family protein n=1 Tax=Paenibacillus sp. GSMTC-2017 TaxID=2794350 RepID=UPI0018D7E907|nr:D-alanyl-D-alanine carboxypeptidase family protein [Paenibacillus sp. GSMTC-2017]MBH5317538.1 D-alanyl-D-alanine carboxypeptidase family protein [Paenibacillus sp. GSMTC-2017]